MSQKQRCCILECSAPDNTKLFRFPTNNDLRAIWRQIIRPHNPDLYRSSEGNLNVLAQRNVCERHFELRYIRHSRRDAISIPTLFTQEEIASRTPTDHIELKMENLYPPWAWVFDTSSYDEVNPLALSLMNIRQDHNYYLTKRLILESSLALEPPVGKELTVVPTSSGSLDVEQIGKLGTSDRFPEITTTMTDEKKIKYPSNQYLSSTGRELLATFREEEAIAESDRRKNQSVVSDQSTNLTAVSDHSKNQTAVSEHSKNQTAESDHSKNQTAVSEHSKNQTAVSDHSKNQTAVSDHSKNQTAVSDHCENQPVLNINEDAVDDSQYSAGVDDTGADDECNNISDDDCQAVVDDDSSFYHNVSKLSDDKDDMDMEPQNLDKNEDLHDGFQCNYCSGEIKGYRYTCVQCPDYDLCGSCEARGAHCLHYVLRIPRPKPYAEIQPLQREIRRLLSGADTDMLWKQPDEIIKEELNDDFDLLNIDVMPISSETEYVPEMSTFTSTTKSHQNKQDDNDTVPEMIIQPRLTTSHEHNATTHTRQKETVTADRSAASTSSPYPRFVKIAPESTFLTFESSLQAIDNTRTTVSESSTASTRLAPDENTVLTIESSPKVIDKTRTPASESSLFTASTSVSSDGNTVLTIATNVEDTDSTSRSVPSTSRLYTSSSIKPAGTETISNKIKITGDSYLRVPMATKRKCSDNIDASKPRQVELLKGSKKLIVMPSKSKVIGPGTRFKIIKKPSATGQPQAQGTAYEARHRTRSTQRDQDAPR